MPAVSTMILRSMRMIGEKSRGATLDSNEQVECLAEFNTALESWTNERLLCYAIQEGVHTLTASTNSYTVGTNGTITSAGRPLKIVDPCYVRDSSGYDTPVTILNREQYMSIVDKSAGYTVPVYLFYDGDFSATSTATLYLYPSPTASLTLHFSAWKQLTAVSTLSVNLALPPGYQLFLESNFAIHLAAGLTPISQELAKIARDSKAAIKTTNLQETVTRLDTAVGYNRRASILTGP